MHDIPKTIITNIIQLITVTKSINENHIQINTNLVIERVYENQNQIKHGYTWRGMTSVRGSPGNSWTNEWSHVKSSILFLTLIPPPLSKLWFFKSRVTDSTDDDAVSGFGEEEASESIGEVVVLKAQVRKDGWGWIDWRRGRLTMGRRKRTAAEAERRRRARKRRREKREQHFLGFEIQTPAVHETTA